MSILGVKKKHVDTTEIEKKIEKINIDLQTINSNDKQLYKGINNVILRVNNNEKMININKNKPDRTIICIYAGIDGPITTDQQFTFGDGGESFLIPHSGLILSASLVSFITAYKAIVVELVLNDKGVVPTIIAVDSMPHYFDFPHPIKVKAGDILRFRNRFDNPSSINALVSVIIELFI